MGSTRFPGKPMALVRGRPMVEQTYRAAMKAKLLDRVIVASDSQKIVRHIEGIGGHAALTGECATGTDRVTEAFSGLSEQERLKYDVVVNIQGDEPGINPDHVDLLVDALRQDPRCVLSTLATRLVDERDGQSRDVVKCVVDVNSHALYFSRALIPHSKTGHFASQHVPYLRHVGVYAYRRDFLAEYSSLPQCPLELAEDLEQLRVLHAGHKIKVVPVDSTLPGIDTVADLDAFNAQ
ncbi:hypothetical protein P43SY_002465 [Pythium insidiosum]|uniref:3-deoxy-manno-octulosonate cytidylyltransferase n=1 Tax=Pythium insidiosum TaxID=114742 RepID=A0AAD5Q3R4_PYTIN|nr:hypothetical protein P43SY_002465 [Pythium insidiosum]